MEAVEFSLPELVDLALCTPEVGTVNFNILRILLHGIIQKLGLEGQPIALNDLASNHVTHFKEYIQGQGGTTSPMPGVFRYYPTGYNYAGKNPNDGKGFQSTGSTPRPNVGERPNTGASTKSTADEGSARRPAHTKSVSELEDKVGRLERHLEALYALPTNQNLLDKEHPQGMSVNDMWQIIQLNNRVAAAEAAIQKMASLIEDLAKELKNVRTDNAGIKKLSDGVVKTNSQLEMKVNPLADRCKEAQSAIDVLKKELGNIKNQWKNEIDQLQQATGVDVSKIPTFMQPMQPGQGQQPKNQQMPGQPQQYQQIPGQQMPGQPGQPMQGTMSGQRMPMQQGQPMQGQPGQQPGQQGYRPPMPGQQMYRQPMPGQPGQPMYGQPGQQMSGQPGQQMPGQPGQQMQGQPGQPMQGQPGQQMPGQPGQQMSGQPGQPMQGQQGQPMHGQPGQQMSGQPGQPMQGQPGQQMSGQPGQPMHGQQGQPMQGQPMQGHPMQGQPMQGQPMQGQPGQQISGQPGQQISGQPGQPMQGQPMQGQPMQGQPMQGQPGQQMSGQPGQQMYGQPGQQMSGQPGQPIQGQPMQGQPGQPMQGQSGQPMQGQPGQQMQGQPGQQMQGQPGQQMQGQPGQQMQGQPGQQMQGQPGQQMQGQPMQGQPGQQMQGQPMQGQPGQMPGQPGMKMPIPGQQGQQILGQPMQGQQMYGQPMPGQQMPGQPGQQMPSQPGQKMSNKPGQPMYGPSGQQMPGQPGQQSMPGQPMPGQPMSGQQGQPMPGQSEQLTPEQQGQQSYYQPMPDQQMYGQPMPGQPMYGQPMPGQPMYGQPMPGQPMYGQPMPDQQMPGQMQPGQQMEPGMAQQQGQPPMDGMAPVEQQQLVPGGETGESTLQSFQPGAEPQTMPTENSGDKLPVSESEQIKWGEEKKVDSFDSDEDDEHHSSPPVTGLSALPQGKPWATTQPKRKPGGPGHQRLKHGKPIVHTKHTKSKPGIREDEDQAPAGTQPAQGEVIQKELQKQYGQLQGMQRQLANDIQDKMEFIYQRLLNEIANQQMTTSPFLNLGPEKCTGPGVCHGHEMDALAAAHQHPPASAVPGERKRPEGSTDGRDSGKEREHTCPNCQDDSCPHCKDAIALKNLKTPKKPTLDTDEESGLKPLETPELLNKEMKSMILLPPLEDLREELKNAGKIVGAFDETDMLEKMATLWEAVNALKHNDEAMAVRIIQQDAAIKKLPQGGERPQRKSFAEAQTRPSGAPAPALVEDPSVRRLDVPDVLNKDDIQLIFTNLNNLLLDNVASKQRLDSLSDTVRGLENQIVTKQMMIDALSDKADKGQMNTKVSYDEFGTSMDELTTRMQNLLSEVYQKNETWKHITDHLSDELAEKLDKTELAPVRAYFKSHLKALEDRVRYLTEQLEEPDPAGTRRKLLKDMNCISCNRHANISGVTNAPVLPLLGPILAGHSTASKRAFDLHNMRAQKGRYDPDSVNLNMLESNLRNPRRTQSGRSLNDPDVMQLVNRYVGGSHTAISNSDRLASFNRARNSNPGGDGPMSNANMPMGPMANQMPNDYEEEEPERLPPFYDEPPEQLHHFMYHPMDE